jgi:hypothetical protein
MQFLNYTLDKYRLTVDSLPDDLKKLVQGYQTQYAAATAVQKQQFEQQFAQLEKTVVIRIAQQGEAALSFLNTPLSVHDGGASMQERFERSEGTPQYFEPKTPTESITLQLNAGEPFPKYKGKFHWVAEIVGNDPKYKFKRNFVSDRVDEAGNQYSASATLHEGKFYEIQDGYDKFFATIENAAIKKVSESEMVELFNAPKREPRPAREPQKDPSVSEPKNTSNDVPFAQYMSIIEQYRQFNDRVKSDNRYEKDLKLESFVDSEGSIYLKLSRQYSNNTYDNWKESTDWTRIGKGGKVETYYPEQQSKVEFYQFGEGKNKHYGLPVKNENGWYRPCKENGYPVDFVNGKIVDANIKRLNDLGFETRNIVGFRFASTGNVIFKDQTPSVAKRVGAPDLKPIVLPSRIKVPDEKRAPHYKVLDNSTKLNSLIIKQEILLGKIEAARYQTFDGQQDMYVYAKELAWSTPTTAPESSYHDRIWVSDNKITWGSYYIRYNGKKGNAYVYLNGENAASSSPSAAKPVEPKPNNDQATAQKFFKTAESLRDKSKKWYESHRNAQTNTPKRQREYSSGACYADIMREKAAMYDAIGKAYENGNLPKVLIGISPAMAQDDLNKFVYTIETPSYYAVNRGDKRNFERYGKPKEGEIEQWAALEQLLKGNSSTPSVSDEELKKQRRLKEIENSMKFSKQENFFPTPLNVIREMFNLAKIQDGMTVLEPSAGLGHIADAVRERYPNSPIDVCESLYTLQEYLKLKGYDVVNNDTMKLTGKYDRVMMNPPFTPIGIDGDHVKHCFDLLKPNGILVAVMSAGSFYRSSKKDKAFQEWFEENGGYKIALPEGSFNGKDAFVQTGVNTVLVKLTKAAVQNSTPSVQTPKNDVQSLISDLKMAKKYSDLKETHQISLLIEDLELAAKYA